MGKALRLSTLADSACRRMTLSLWLRLEQRCGVLGGPQGAQAESYWVGNKLLVGLRIKAYGANTGDIAWGLISAERKDW